MPKFLFLLHSEQTDLDVMSADEKAALFGEFVTWSEALKARGVLRAVESLMDRGGTTVRRRGDAVVVDGPYAELKELVSGLYVVEVADVAAAEALAAECPLLRIGGAVQVRAIADFPVRP